MSHFTILKISHNPFPISYRCLQADSWRVVSASDDRTLKVSQENFICFMVYNKTKSFQRLCEIVIVTA